MYIIDYLYVTKSSLKSLVSYFLVYLRINSIFALRKLSAMRHLYITLSTLLLSVMVLLPNKAQGQHHFNYRDSLGTYKVVFRPNDRTVFNSRSLNIPVSSGAHEIRLGMAYCADTPSDYTTSNNWHPIRNFSELGEQHSLGDELWFTVGFEGGRWFKEWFFFGGSLVWSGGFMPVRYTPTHQRVSTLSSNNIAIIPIARFAWLRRGIVQLYSGVGIGLALGFNEHLSYVETLTDLAYDVTFIGISIGRELFGYIDLGAGYRGLISFGIGYRFNN